MERAEIGRQQREVKSRPRELQSTPLNEFSLCSPFSTNKLWNQTRESGIVRREADREASKSDRRPKYLTLIIATANNGSQPGRGSPSALLILLHLNLQAASMCLGLSRFLSQSVCWRFQQDTRFEKFSFCSCQRGVISFDLSP